MSKELRLPYFQTESFGAVDGPGVRFVVFTQGCFYRCLYCHNPESWELKDTGKSFSVDDIIEQYKHNITFYKKGGIAISGGDPLIHIDFMIALAKRCHEKNISLALDTSGVNFTKATESKYLEICKYKPLWIVDCKQINLKRHEILTGVKEQRDISLIKFLEKNKQDFWVRQVLLPKYTDDPKDLEDLGKLLKTLKHMKRFELLPYHRFGVDKYKELNIDYPLKGIRVPTSEHLAQAMKHIKKGME